MRWERLKQSEAMEMENGPGKRWGHTCNAIRGGKLLYVFGGYGRHNSQTNQVHVFDNDTQTWSQPAIKGIPPIPRDSHTCTTVGDNLFVFGGTNGLSPLSDLHVLDTLSNTWISPSVRGDRPEAREGHSAALNGKHLYIFGGCGQNANRLKEIHYNDVYILDTETFVWQRAVTSGRPPAARDSHSCSSWKNNIIIIGGEDEHDYYLADVHILDTDTLIWKELYTSGQLLTPRAGHSTVTFGKHIFVFGGFTDAQNLYGDLYVLDLDAGIWDKVVPCGDSPSARFSMSGDCLDPSKCGVLVFFGGCNNNLEALDDMYYLHTELPRDDGRDERRLEKLSLRKQLKLKCQEQALGALDNSTPISMPYSSQQNQQYFHLNMYRPPTGKRTFQAVVTQNIANRYTIETVIDGRPLRGILFSTSSTTNVNPDGKKDAANIESELNENQDPVQKCSTSHEPHNEAANTSVLKDSGPSNEGPSQEVLNRDSENLVVLNETVEGSTLAPENLATTLEKQPAAAEASTLALENLAITLEKQPGTAEASASIPAKDDEQVGASEGTSN